jgi:hypothetical protein
VKRLADPYRDLDVIDSRAPRFNQATIGALSALAVATGWWWLLGVLAAQLAVGLTFGRRFCLPCLAYFELVQPRFGEGPLEDSRPPRFANLVGAVFLAAATGGYAGGLSILGAVLGGLVAGLALLAAATGFCTAARRTSSGGCSSGGRSSRARCRGSRRAHVADRRSAAASAAAVSAGHGSTRVHSSATSASSSSCFRLRSGCLAGASRRVPASPPHSSRGSRRQKICVPAPNATSTPSSVATAGRP